MKTQEAVYSRAEREGKPIYPFQRAQIDKSNPDHLMPPERVSLLPKEDFERYVKALYHIQNENAGGYDGWSNAQKTLKELGAKEHKRTEGHRVFVSISFNSPEAEDAD